MNNQSGDDTYWSDVQDFSARLKKENLLAGEKFMMHTLKAVQGKVKEARLNKPFEEWTFDDMLNSFPRELQHDT